MAALVTISRGLGSLTGPRSAGRVENVEVLEAPTKETITAPIQLEKSPELEKSGMSKHIQKMLRRNGNDRLGKTESLIKVWG